MHNPSFFDLFLLFAAFVFAWKMLERSIARRTADEIERRSKPKTPPPPPVKPLNATDVAGGRVSNRVLRLYFRPFRRGQSLPLGPLGMRLRRHPLSQGPACCRNA